MSTIAKSAGVVFAALVGVPKIDERPRNRTAGASENLSAEFDQPRLAVWLDEIGAFGRGGFEKRPFALPHGRCVAVMALRRRCKRLRERIIDHKSRRGERAHGEQSAACRLKLHHGLLTSYAFPPLLQLSRYEVRWEIRTASPLPLTGRATRRAQLYGCTAIRRNDDGLKAPAVSLF